MRRGFRETRVREVERRFGREDGREYVPYFPNSDRTTERSFANCPLGRASIELPVEPEGWYDMPLEERIGRKN